MNWRQQKIQVDETTGVSSVWAIPDAYVGDCLILAHGAGNDMHNPLLSFLQEALARAGVLTVKFNFPYKEQGRKAPDRAPRLEQTWRAVLRAIRDDAELKPKRLFIGGKSMGGRIASLIAAQGEPLDGLIFLGYPLHPAGKPEKLRSAHLPAIACPMLFIQGSRDRLCGLDLLNDAIKTLTVTVGVKLHVIDEGDHSFKVPKRTGRTEQDIYDDIAATIIAWIHGNA